MTTRRTLLRLAGGAVGATALGACTPRSANRPVADPAPPAADLLFVTTPAGLTAIDTRTGRATMPAHPALANPEWTRIVAAQAEGTGTRLTTLEPQAGKVIAGGTLRDRLEPRVVSFDGRLVALITPPPVPPAQPYLPGNRTRTTVVVADAGGERTRLDLPGNLVPEAFSTDGNLLFVLDYLPPQNPDRYRVRVLDLTTGELRSLLTKLKVPVPTGAEEEMRGDAVEAVYDPARHVLFSLYVHQPEHLHTRQLLGGARPGAPHVHAFVHTLNLVEGWAYCIDLPAPFGETNQPGTHTIARSADGHHLYVLDATRGALAHLDPDALTVERVTTFAEPGLPGKVGAVCTRDGGFVVAAGTQLISFPGDPSSRTPKTSHTVASNVHGLAVNPDGQRVYLGLADAVVLRDLASPRELHRVPIPGLLALKHVAFAS